MKHTCPRCLGDAKEKENGIKQYLWSVEFRGEMKYNILVVGDNKQFVESIKIALKKFYLKILSNHKGTKT